MPNQMEQRVSPHERRHVGQGFSPAEHRITAATQSRWTPCGAGLQPCRAPNDVGQGFSPAERRRLASTDGSLRDGCRTRSRNRFARSTCFSARADTLRAWSSAALADSIELQQSCTNCRASAEACLRLMRKHEDARTPAVRREISVDQLVDVDRLQQAGLAAGLECAPAVFRISMPGEQDHVCAPRGLSVTERPGHPQRVSPAGGRQQHHVRA